MRQKLLPIIVLLVVVLLASFGLIIKKMQDLKSDQNSPKAPVNQAETVKAQLARLRIDSSEPVVGEPLVLDISLDDLSTDISALSIRLRLPYQAKTAPFDLSQAPFSLNPELTGSGWQILINQVEDNPDNQVLIAEVAIGRIGENKQAELPQPLIQLTLPTNSEVSSGKILIDAVTTKVVDDQGETLPVQLLAKPYNVLANQPTLTP